MTLIGPMEHPYCCLLAFVAWQINDWPFVIWWPLCVRLHEDEWSHTAKDELLSLSDFFHSNEGGVLPWYEVIRQVSKNSSGFRPQLFDPTTSFECILDSQMGFLSDNKATDKMNSSYYIPKAGIKYARKDEHCIL